MSNKVLAAQLIFLVVAVIGFVLAKIGADGVASGNWGMFICGIILLLAAIIVQIALVMIPLFRAIAQRCRNKQPDEDNDGFGMIK